MFGRIGLLVALASVAVSAVPAAGEDLRIGGTGSALGLCRALAAAFEAGHPGDRVVVVPGLGSGGAIAAVAQNALQIAVAGRSLNAEEQAEGMASQPLLRTPFVFVTARPEPPALTRAQIVAAFAGELRTWPDGAAIKPILRPRSDAASLFMVRRIPGMAAALDALRKRPDVPVEATDQENMVAAEKIAQSLASATLLQVATERPRVSIVTLDGVRPSLDTMESGAYPLAQELYVVTAASPAVLTRRFIEFVASPAGQAVVRASGGSPLLRPPG